MLNEDLIERAGLSNLKKHEAPVGHCLYEADYLLRGVPVAKYLILPIDPETLLRVSETEQSFNEFQGEHVRTFYFDQEGDLRWNLYLVFVLVHAEFEQFPRANMALIERNKRYARKLVVSERDFSSEVPVSQLRETQTSVRLVEPLEEWYDHLQKHGLAFCLDSFRNEKVEHYLIGSEVEALVKPKTDEELLTSSNGAFDREWKISSIRFGRSFRPHCFDSEEPFVFKGVNLFEGANGVGKTTIFEAIELAMTGKVMREEIAEGVTQDDVSNSVWDGELCFTNGECFNESPTAKEQTKREVGFYRNQERKFAKLNERFHRYNYFSSEDAYRFSFTEEGHPDFAAISSQVLFGAEINTYQKHWNRYKDVFQNIKNSLVKQIREHKTLLQDLEERALQIPMHSTSMSVLTRMLDELKLNDLESFPQGDPEKELAWARQLLVHLNDVYAVSRPLENMFDFGIFTQRQLLADIQEKQILKEEVGGYLEQEKELLQSKQALVADLRRNQIRWQMELNEANSDLQKTVEVVRQLQDYETIFLDPPSADHCRTLEKNREFLQSKMKSYEYVQKQWGDLLTASIPALTEGEASKRKQELEQKREGLLQEKYSAMGELRAVQQFYNRIGELTHQIKAAGQEYLLEYTSATRCPLCQAVHSTPDDLRDAIFCAEEQDARNELQERIDQVIQQLTGTERELESVASQLNLWIRIREAAGFLQRMNAVSQNQLSIDEAVSEELFQYVQQANKEMNTTRSQILDIEAAIQRLEIQGFELVRVNKAYEWVKFEPFVQLLYQGKETYSGMVRILEGNRTELRERHEELVGNIAALEKQLQGLLVEVESAQNNAKTLSEQVDTLGYQIKQCSEWLSLIEKVRDRCGSIEEDSSLSGFRGYLQRTIEVAKGISEDVEASVEHQGRLGDFKLYQNKLTDLETRMIRCQQAMNVIGELKTLSQYSEDFMATNIRSISDLFVALHSPNEYEKLDLDSDGNLVAFSHGTNRRKVHIHQLSTGQRTAVTLAVFFTLHMSMPTAPKFVLLDEPVANIDDLNVLGLFDFLRGLYAQLGTQIFITTANAGVAGLFRKKFQFLNEEFRNYRFVRYDYKTHVLS